MVQRVTAVAYMATRTKQEEKRAFKRAYSELGPIYELFGARF